MPIDSEDRQLLNHWKKFLTQSALGISLNLLTFRRPTNLVVSDACPQGMGGFSMASGRAWRLQFQTRLDNKNNIGEFLASVITILLAHHWGDITTEGVVLALTNNSSCVAWLNKCNADPSTHPILCEIARKLASTCLQEKFIIHPQHLPGSDNGASDALSRRFDLGEQKLTRFIKTNFHSQVPENFKICPIPDELSYWISSTLALQHLLVTRSHKPTPTPWSRWCQFITKSGLGNNHFLEGFAIRQRWFLGQCFIHAYRTGLFGQGRHRQATTVGGTRQVLGCSIRKAASELAQIFRRNNWPSPFHDEGHVNQIAPGINDLLKAYDSKDPAPARAEALTIKHLRMVHQAAIRGESHRDLIQSHLIIGAFFFAMRSCEYNSVTNRGCTKLLEVRDIEFSNSDHRVLAHHNPKLL